jgi:hypothetical protein
MTARAREPRTNKYWPVLLLDIAAITVLIILALVTPHARFWWAVLAVLWSVVAALRARNEYKSR